MVDSRTRALPLAEQCRLLSIPHSTFYYRLQGESSENLKIMSLIDKEYTKTPFYGSRRLAVVLNQHGHAVNRKRMQRLMRIMGIEAIYPKPKLSLSAKDHKIYPYLLRGVTVERKNHVWSTDFSYVPMQGGFMYFAAVIDWATRYVLSWRISNTMDPSFCIESTREALKSSRPEIFNTDQGSQSTCNTFLSVFEGLNVAISMDGRGRALDNVFVERLWRTVKYEDLYLKDYADGWKPQGGLEKYFQFYNHERPHQALDYQTPASAYFHRKR